MFTASTSFYNQGGDTVKLLFSAQDIVTVGSGYHGEVYLYLTTITHKIIAEQTYILTPFDVIAA